MFVGRQFFNIPKLETITLIVFGPPGLRENEVQKVYDGLEFLLVFNGRKDRSRLRPPNKNTHETPRLRFSNLESKARLRG